MTDVTADEALTHLALLNLPERERVLRAIARTHPQLVLDAAHAEEAVWHGTVKETP